MDRREFLGVIGSAGLGTLAGCVGANVEGSSTETSSFTYGASVGLETVATSFTQPIAMADVPGTDFHYVADKVGTVHAVGGDLDGRPVILDVRDRLVSPLQYEQGLLGLALHPDFRSNGKFYVRYSAPVRDDVPPGFSHTFVLSEFRASPDRTKAVPGFERIVLEIPEPGPTHQSGDIEFGPEGNLFVGVGDGGGNDEAIFHGYLDAGPGHAEDWYLVNQGGNGQDVTENLLGSILRIDVDGRDDGKGYAVPEDNPLVGKLGLDEHYAWGFRNPYRMSFDRGRLFVGDVGYTSYEEINVVERGGNYGWNVREGPECVNANSAVRNGLTDDAPDAIAPAFDAPPLSLIDYVASKLALEHLPACPTRSPRGTRLSDPLVTYPYRRAGSQFGQAVIGGYVYRGDRIDELRDQYVFGDLGGQNSGRLFVTDPDGEERPLAIRELQVRGTDSGRIGELILSFGRDRSGELYVLTSLLSEGSGTVYRLTTPGG